MFQYTLNIILGTNQFVINELKHKFPDIILVKEFQDSITFESLISDIDSFRILYSPLGITLKTKDNNGKEVEIQRNLYRRVWRKEYVPAGINPALAYILCKIADLKEEDIVLDPFCGGGTIPITAALYFNVKKVLASDISGKAVDITIRNFNSAKVNKNKYSVFRSNVSQLKLQKDYVNKVITNLPFGIRTGDHERNSENYLSFAKNMKRLLKDKSLLVILTQEKELLTNIFNSVHFKLLNKYDIKQGGLIPTIFVYEQNL